PQSTKRGSGSTSNRDGEVGRRNASHWRLLERKAAPDPVNQCSFHSVGRHVSTIPVVSCDVTAGDSPQEGGARMKADHRADRTDRALADDSRVPSSWL